jgi:predicted DsbA family dithiol-disulfide isomerase
VSGAGEAVGEAGGAGPSAGPAPGAPPLELVYYTDPLCCWSWAFEPHWRRLRAEFGAALDCRYRMAGMIADWGSYSDPLNSVSRPLQMGPIWREAQHLAGVPVDDRIWAEDPPASSYPACLAVKAAELQSADAADLYLRRLREAVMTQRCNIARREVLVELAEELAAAAPDRLDAERLGRDLDGQAARDALREDIKEARYRGIGRFPTLTLRNPGGAGIVLVGYRPYEALLSGLARVAPELASVRQARAASDG